MGDSTGAPVLAAAADQVGGGAEEPFLDWAWTEAIEATELLRSVLAALGLHDGFPRLRGDVNVYGAPMVTVGRITPAAARRLAAALGRVVAGGVVGGVVAGGVAAACGAGGGVVADLAGGLAGNLAPGMATADVGAESVAVDSRLADTFRTAAFMGDGGAGSVGGAVTGDLGSATALGMPPAGLPGAATTAGRLDGLGALHALSGAEAFGAGHGMAPGMVPGQGNYAMSLPA